MKHGRNIKRLLCFCLEIKNTCLEAFLQILFQMLLISGSTTAGLTSVLSGFIGCTVGASRLDQRLLLTHAVRARPEQVTGTAWIQLRGRAGVRHVTEMFGRTRPPISWGRQFWHHLLLTYFLHLINDDVINSAPNQLGSLQRPPEYRPPLPRKTHKFTQQAWRAC